MIGRAAETMGGAERSSALLMWAISIPLTWTGVERWIHGATTIVGFATSVLGLLIALMGVVYWIRRLHRQAGGREDKT